LAEAGDRFVANLIDWFVSVVVTVVAMLPFVLLTVALQDILPPAVLGVTVVMLAIGMPKL
jgi:hypothetical protein